MGAKRPSIRTLPSGEKVMHHPPDKHHPEGMLVLIPDRSALRERHDARLSEHRHRHRELKDVHHRHIRIKKAAQRAGGVPAEKSPI